MLGSLVFGKLKAQHIVQMASQYTHRGLERCSFSILTAEYMLSD